MEFCDGTTWNAIVKKQASVTAPAGSGYFVMSHDTWTGNLKGAAASGLAGANAKCLSDLTTYTSWMGYSDANSRGLLVAAKVKAFLCAATGGCNTLNASTTYYFANAGASWAGGASFTTDASSIGPGDTNSWAAATYFGGLYHWWAARQVTSDTQWLNSVETNHCASWTAGTSASHGFYGRTAYTTSIRWEVPASGNTCGNSFHLICYVNP